MKEIGSERGVKRGNGGTCEENESENTSMECRWVRNKGAGLEECMIRMNVI